MNMKKMHNLIQYKSKLKPHQDIIIYQNLFKTSKMQKFVNILFSSLWRNG